MHEISRSGLAATQARLNVSAHNTANTSTDKFSKQRVTQNERKTGGTEAKVDTLELSENAKQIADEVQGPQNNVNNAEEAVERIRSKHEFEQNAQTIRAKDQMTKSLLDTLG